MIAFLRRLLGRKAADPPTSGPGGWKVLVFRYNDPPGEELHVLAPMEGPRFDWELLRVHVESKTWPPFRHEPGRATGVIDWMGHHTYLVPETGERMRMAFGEFIPGEFRAGAAARSVTLIAVRDAAV